MKRQPALLALPFLMAAGALVACGEQSAGGSPNRVGPATATGVPRASEVTPFVDPSGDPRPRASETAPFVDPTLGPRPRAGGTGKPSTTLSPGQGVPAALDCGTFVLGQGDKPPESATRCFVDAAQAGHPARLKVTRPTVEGDPIPVTYTAGADGRTEVLTDSRQDGFGPKQITREICQGPSVAEFGIKFNRCTPPAPVTN
uniref:hypothetical protein n=1 Tax=Paractinoplanes polyasparticus TaxID=2856853 RepID=UPI001C85F65A|nr:hypothetical protein [Actinoplanes polyasparticus]